LEIARLQIAVDSTQAKSAGKDLKSLEVDAKSVAKEANIMGKAIGAAVAAFATGALVDWITATSKGIAELDKFSRLANSSVEQFQAVAFGAARYGVEADKLSDVLKDVNDKVGDFLQTGAGPLADFFENIGPRVGVTADQFRNLSGPDALQLYVRSLEQANVSQAEMTFFMEAIANDATLLIPLFADGGAELSKFADQAERLGLILEAETVEQARQFNESLGVMQAVSGGLGQQIVAQLLPSLNDLTGTMISVSTETEFANTAAEIIGGTLKSLASVGIVVGAAFQTTGQAIGATAAALVSAARGDFSEAWSIIQEGSADYADGVESALGRVEGLWDGTAAETARAAASARLALREASRGTGEYSSATTKLTADQKEAARAAQQLAIAHKSNEQQIIDLAESLYQAMLPADELAKRQATLGLNQYATPEQIASVRMLAGELQRVEDIAARKKEFGADPSATIRGTVTPLSGGAFDDQAARFDAEREAEEIRFQEQQQRLQEAMAVEAVSKQEAWLLEEQFYQEHIGRLNQIDQARTDMLLQQTSQGFSQMSSDIMEFAEVYAKENKTMFAIAKASSIASTIIDTYAAAQAAYKAMAGIPYVGPALGIAAAAAAVGAGMARVSAIQSQTMSFDGGGFTGSGPRSGGVDGKGGFMAVMHPNETVLDHTKGQGMGGGVTVNVIESKDKAGTQEKRTDADGSESVDVFVSDIYGDGPRGKAIQRAFGLNRVGQ
jgi:hypothetical protein